MRMHHPSSCDAFLPCHRYIFPSHPFEMLVNRDDDAAFLLRMYAKNKLFIHRRPLQRRQAAGFGLALIQGGGEVGGGANGGCAHAAGHPDPFA